MSNQWWRDAVIYQIYPRSFADSNGDGIGDLPGITSRVDYLASLGIDAVWLSPFYPSALADGGYDVDDYCDVDPRLGTLDDFDDLVAALHGAGIKILIDIVPNHTSDRHEWFRAALAAEPGSPERDRYIFRRGDNGQPPNDWLSGFGGSIWEPVGDGWWYFHFFAREQPDLNWDNPEVRAMFLDVLRFWLDRGVDGFRVDVAHGMKKDWAGFDRPWSEVGFETKPGHPFWDVDPGLAHYRDWRDLFDSYDPPRFAVAEADARGDRRVAYARALGQSFNFQMQNADWTPGSFAAAIEAGLADAALVGSTTWLLGCHDSPRVATRFGLPLIGGHGSQHVARAWLMTDGTEPALDHAAGTRRARAAALTLLALPGSMYIYQGDELGLHEVGDLPEEVLQDPIAFRNREQEKGRDGCRVPLPWTAQGPSFGFGDAPAHLPQPAWFGDHAVESQAEGSTLELYRSAIASRRSLSGPLEWMESPSSVLRFRRGDVECLVCFDAVIPIDADRVIVASSPLSGGVLGPDQTAWLRLG